MKKKRKIFWIALVIIFIAGCTLFERGNGSETGSLATETIVPTDTPQNTPTPLAPVGVFLTPEGADPVLVEQLNPIIAEFIRTEGLRYQVLPKLSGNDFQTDDYQIVVALPPYPDLAALAQSAPETKFLALGFNDLEPTDNLSVMRSGGGAYDIQGFIAGYIAAMITTDWRVGALSLQENEDALAAREGFQVGVKYYCGLCNPKYAPTGINYIYPKYIDLAADATDIEVEANVNFLVDRVVNTYYIVPQLEKPMIFRMLVGHDKKIIGSGGDFREEYRDHWVASLEYDMLAALQEYWPEFLASETGILGSPPLLITDVNSDFLSPGKLKMVEAVLDELISGYIKTSFED